MSFQAMHDMQRCCSGNKADLCQINSPVCPLLASSFWDPLNGFASPFDLADIHM